MALANKINKIPSKRNCCQHTCSTLNAMAEGTYEYECMRAELLGVEKPDYNDFLKRQKEQLAKEVEEEQVETECLTSVENTNSTTAGISNRLDELNTILASTQKRINRFKTSCGSFTNMLKAKIGRRDSNSSFTIPENAEVAAVPQEEEKSTREQPEMSQRKADLCRGLDGNLDKLDSLLNKAETAHYSMLEQRKQMNQFLK